VKVPRSSQGNWPRAATDRDVESMLEHTVELAEAQRGSPFQAITFGSAAAGVGGVLLPSLGLAALRRRRKDRG